MTSPLERHPLAPDFVLLDVEHMCPAENCGIKPSPICLVCGGSGLLTEEQLGRWQSNENLRIRLEGGL